MKPRCRTADQIAALPVHWEKTGKLRVLMVTSRDSGRWVMPKGWLMDGKSPWRAAEIEALEEAGATGFISKRALGTYHYDKLLEDGSSLRCRVTLYPMVVGKLKRRWKERAQRKRHWFAPKRAAGLVAEKELADLLTGLAEKPDLLAAIKKLRKAA
ncbi:MULTISPECIES: NUDIX hydrolase [Roseobacteraceae]|uniref:NUDIX hydrolase n=1 Tax=Roseobacteraceae TaxID=2854170 RepID=UPI002B277C0B|nr:MULTISPECIES: NUDIX domain-containing protein [Roseobacteraceae]